MNLKELFKIQAKLDEKIVKEKGLEGQDLLDKKILALQVELGELANEWRGFKFWSKNQEPRGSLFSSCADEDAEYFFCGECHTEASVEDAKRKDYECTECFNGFIGMKERNLLLEEYVDCLHFILSIGLDCRFEDGGFYTNHKGRTVDQFNKLFDKIGDFSRYHTKGNYEWLFCLFLGLGDFLGFTWEQIEQAYLDKNKVNHARQMEGY
jgi:dimeric dUTPase (all-alpha-NTP-PPase superfamily)